LQELNWSEDDPGKHLKSHPAKLALAARLRRETTLTVREIANRLRMGSWKSLNNKLYLAGKMQMKNHSSLQNMRKSEKLWFDPLSVGSRLTMKTSLTVCFAIATMFISRAFCADIEPSDWGPTNCEAQMSITLAGGTNHVKLGKDTRLLVQIKNLSTNAIFLSYIYTCANTDPRDGLSCIIRDPFGKNITPKCLDSIGPGRLFGILPNTTEAFTFPIGQLCAFDKVGTYMISARKSTLDGKRAVTSNVLRVSVPP